MAAGTVADLRGAGGDHRPQAVRLSDAEVLRQVAQAVWRIE
jgi:hypothetical protein